MSENEEKREALHEHIQKAIRRGGSYSSEEIEAFLAADEETDAILAGDDSIKRYLHSEPLITVTPDEPDKGTYTIFSLVGDREVIFNAFGLLKLAEWIEAHRDRLEREAREFAERYGFH
jgi:hypothetical protein